MPLVMYLIDGHALAYRAYFALNRSSGSFSTSSGEPTAGIFGFTSILLRLLEQDQPEYMAVAFDTGKTFRDDLYAEYKGTREKMPDDLRQQIERIRQLVDAFSIPRLEIEGYEADDVLGSVANQAVKAGFRVKIITGDRDLLQLVNDSIIVNLPGKSISEAKDYFTEDVLAYMGVRPEKIVDFKALVGDKSDNIPGVQGIGEKTAVALLNEYGSLDGIYKNLSEMTASVRKKLEIAKDSAYLSQLLARIVTDLEIPIDFKKARLETFDPAAVELLFRELEFRMLIGRFQQVAKIYGKTVKPEGVQMSLFPQAKPSIVETATVVKSDIDVQVIDNAVKLEALERTLNNAKTISFDTETTSIDQMQANLVGISLSIEPGHAFYIPVGHADTLGEQLEISTVLRSLKKPLTDPSIQKVGHNLKYDWIMLARYGLEVEPLGFDTMIAEWLIRPDSRNLGLKNLSWVRLGHRMTAIQELIGKGKSQVTMAQVPIREAAAYAADDAQVILTLMPLLENEIEQCNALDLFRELEMPLIRVLASMEMAGVRLDVNYLRDMSVELGERLGQIEGQIYQMAGTSFNLNSPQQLSEILFDRLKIPPPDRTQKTASGFYSTAAEVLELMRGKNPVIDLVLEYRELSKLKSTYLDALPQQVNPNTGRLHTTYNQTGSVTGRIASSDPNLQNIPIRTEIGRRVRKAFVAAPGNILLSVDYSQVELRIVAHIAGDEAMLNAFRAGQDIHTTTAAAIYDMSLDKVTKQQRRHAKAINFGLIYGMSPFGLTRTTELTLAEAEDFVEAYFNQFPGVRSYLDQVRNQVYEKGYVETLLGRKRYFPGLELQKNQIIRNRQEREAINAPIQGTAADIMKIAMLRLPDALAKMGLSARMLLQVHDELVLECPEREMMPAVRLVKNVMENAYKLSIPLITEAREGYNWDEMSVITGSE